MRVTMQLYLTMLVLYSMFLETVFSFLFNVLIFTLLACPWILFFFLNFPGMSLIFIIIVLENQLKISWNIPESPGIWNKFLNGHHVLVKCIPSFSLPLFPCNLLVSLLHRWFLTFFSQILSKMFIFNHNITFLGKFNIMKYFLFFLILDNTPIILAALHRRHFS